MKGRMVESFCREYKKSEGGRGERVMKMGNGEGYELDLDTWTVDVIPGWVSVGSGIL